MKNPSAQGFEQSVANPTQFYSTSGTTCPVSGVYEFTLSLLSNEAAPLSASISVGSHVVRIATQDDDDKSPGFTSLIVSCSADQEVLVEFDAANLVPASTLGTFSGELLFEDTGTPNGLIFNKDFL